jgi:hypothetical protein
MIVLVFLIADRENITEFKDSLKNIIAIENL